MDYVLDAATDGFQRVAFGVRHSIVEMILVLDGAASGRREY